MSINTQHISFFILIVLFCFMSSSCDNDLNVNADWKEVPVVFGILDPSLSHNYIRIQKAFLGEEGNAKVWAKEVDSSFLNNVSVKLIEIENGVTRREIPLELVVGDTLGLSKDTGIFANSPNYLYRCNEPIHASRIGFVWSYRLIIHNENTGKIYTALTIVPGAVHVFSPFNGNEHRINLSDQDKPLVVSYREGYQVKMYDFEARFRYEEYHVDAPTVIKVDSISWNMFSNKETVSLTAQRSKNILARGATLYEILEARLENNPKLRRRAIDMGFYFHGGGQEIFTYIEVNKPSLGIVQKKPEYTNIEDGLGIFSGKHTSAYPHVIIVDDMLETLRNSTYTAELNFE
jgi:hypothetical protein